jgi:hypothetical protein
MLIFSRYGGGYASMAGVSLGGMPGIVYDMLAIVRRAVLARLVGRAVC